MHNKVAEFRFYEELNDFLPPANRKSVVSYTFTGTPAIKDAVEAIGVPHPEIDLIVVNGRSVGFDYRLQDGDRAAVYPMFEGIDITPIVRLRARPLRTPRFVVDRHLGKLARRLRMLGFDTAYRKDISKREIIEVSLAERRAILTRDRELLKAGGVTHGYWLRSAEPARQITEVIDRFDLQRSVAPFKRCMLCNGVIRRKEKRLVEDRLPPGTARAIDEYYECSSCGKIYWKGSHYQRMADYITELLE